LGRDVALKILPREVSGDPDRLARFEREARLLASLNHPNLATIYGVEEDAGVRAIVMELIEGGTLAERLASRSRSPGTVPRGLPTTLDIARQLADALDAAHERGIIHRDLKPANIKITPDGIVKALDFGIAKVASLENRQGTPQRAMLRTSASSWVLPRP
jgi:serine/threonine-protein kinase